MNTAAVSPVVEIKNKRRKQKYRSPIDDDDSSEVPEQTACAEVSAGRCLRSRDSTAPEHAKKCRRSSEVDDNDYDDDYEPETVSRPKRRKRRRR